MRQRRPVGMREVLHFEDAPTAAPGAGAKGPSVLPQAIERWACSIALAGRGQAALRSLAVRAPFQVDDGRELGQPGP